MKWLNKRKPVQVQAFRGTVAPHIEHLSSVICLNISSHLHRVRNKRSVPVSFHDAVKEIHQIMNPAIGGRR